MQRLKYILRYLNFLRKSKTKFDVHPPFLYNLVTEVFEDKKEYEEYLPVEKLKSLLLSDDRQIEVIDLGAGSSVDNNNMRLIKDITNYSSKNKKISRLLFRLSRYFQPNNILELGTSMGLSAAYLASGNKDSQVTTIEGCPNISAQAIKNIKSINIRNITAINGSFDQELPGYLSSITQLDFAFIDGNHLEKPTINYFEQCLLKTVNSSCIIFDDIHWSEGMEKAWDYIQNHQDVTLSIDLFYMGIVFFNKELSKQHFVIRF